MTPNQPYLLRAFYEWIVDNNLTPYIVVDAHYAGTQVPQEFVQDGQIVLNMSPASTGNLQLGLQDIMFDARFGGVPRNIVVPCPAVLAIYAKEKWGRERYLLLKRTLVLTKSKSKLRPLRPNQSPRRESLH